LADLIRKELSSGGSVLRGTYDQPLVGYKIIVNAGNGAGGFFADLLASVGADISGSLYLEPDGTFPNHPANPEDPASMAATAHAVIHHQADLGLVFDTVGGDGGWWCWWR